MLLEVQSWQEIFIHRIMLNNFFVSCFVNSTFFCRRGAIEIGFLGFGNIQICFMQIFGTYTKIVQCLKIKPLKRNYDKYNYYSNMSKYEAFFLMHARTRTKGQTWKTTRELQLRFRHTHTIFTIFKLCMCNKLI